MKDEKIGTRQAMSVCVQALIELEDFLHEEGFWFAPGEGDELYDVLYKILKDKKST
jgi:hypothetical protein